jgi:hypothetical protein
MIFGEESSVQECSSQKSGREARTKRLAATKVRPPDGARQTAAGSPIGEAGHAESKLAKSRSQSSERHPARARLGAPSFQAALQQPHTVHTRGSVGAHLIFS